MNETVPAWLVIVVGIAGICLGSIVEEMLERLWGKYKAWVIKNFVDNQDGF